MKHLIHSATALVFLLISTSADAAHHLKDAFQARNDAWSAAFNAGDAATLGALYEEDAVLMAPGGAPIVGRAAIADALSGLFGVLGNLKLVTEDVRPAGDAHVVEMGRIIYELTAADGSKTLFTGNYVVVWQQGEDGVWRLFRDIFNQRQTEPMPE